ncbi:MAG: hypothetical protein OXE83_04975, partial [Gammaproteobacteria bacterium]|nr:hypothetical protein [Gammaproteobacteria bacterium]
ERRVDIFFGMFLPKVIEKELCIQVDKVIPEFPIHKALLECTSGCPSKADSHRSVKVDFAVFGRRKEKRQIILVELKTEMESLDKKQLQKMKKAACAGSEKLLEGVQYAAIHSKSKHKYAHLIWKLLDLKCLQLDSTEYSDFKRVEFRKKGPRLNSIFKGLKIDEEWTNVCVSLVVIHPAEPKKVLCAKFPEGLPSIFSGITLGQFASVIEDKCEPFGSDIRIFTDYLRTWDKVEAGKVTPWP